MLSAIGNVLGHGQHICAFKKQTGRSSLTTTVGDERLRMAGFAGRQILIPESSTLSRESNCLTAKSLQFHLTTFLGYEFGKSA